MFAHIRRHQKWLWIFISAAVIISFVWYFNPNQQYGGSGPAPGGPVGTVFGQPLPAREYSDAQREAYLHYLFSYGEWPQDNEITRQLDPVGRETRSRIVLVRQLKEFGVEVSDVAVADWIRNVFQDRDSKVFRQEVYDRFLLQLPQRGLREEDFLRYARHQVGIQHLATVAGSSGRLVTPQAAEFQFRRENEKADTKVVLLNGADFVPKVEVTSDAVQRFYTNRMTAYRLPERVQMAYVEFPITNYYAQADVLLAADTNLAQRIDVMYAQRGPNFYTDASGQVMTAEAAKAKIREEARDEAAKIEARRAAILFANDLSGHTTSTNAANPAEPLEKLAAAKSLAVKLTEPFTQVDGPMGLGLPQQFTRVAFALTPEESIVEEPVVAEQAVYVMAFKQRFPTETQPFDTIVGRVTEDFRRAESQKLTFEAGQALASAITNALARGESFDAAVQAAGYTVQDLPPVSQNARTLDGLPSQLDLTSVKTVAFDLREGQASNFRPGREGGYIVYLEKRLPVSAEEVQSELPAYLEQMRREAGGDAFEAWFEKQMASAQLVLAGDRNNESSANQ